MSRRNLAVAIALALASLPAYALTDEEGTSAIQFNFNNPGARSRAMGGAFLALADDATAAYTNPAGLPQLSRREMSVEWRQTNFSTPHLASGVADSPVHAGYDRADSSVAGPSFVSAVFPLGNVSLAFYRHDNANFNTRFAYAPEGDPDSFVLYPFQSRVDLSDIVYGASAGYALNERWQIGAGLNLHDFEIDSQTVRAINDEDYASTSQIQRGSDRGIGYTVGLRFLATDRLAIGANYRRAPRLTYEAILSAVSVDGTDSIFLRKPSDFDLPDTYGIGLNYRFSDAFAVGFDINRVRYSQLTRRISSAFQDVGSEFEFADVDGLRIKNGTEFHLGGEYVLVDRKVPLSLRAGAWIDPEHNLRKPAPASAWTDSANAAIFSHHSGTQMHWSLGAGLAFERFSVDVAADLSKYSDTVSVSGVFRF